MTQPDPTPAPNLRLYPVFHFLVGLLVRYGGGVRVSGLAHVPRDAVIIAGNHALALDPFVIGYAIPPRHHHLQFMAKQEAFVWPWIGPRLLGPLLRSVGAFPVDRRGRDTRAVRTALRILARGGMVGIFPQGTRHGAELHGGVALIALKSGAPIIPVRVRHDPPLARGLPGGRWHVHFGPPLHPRPGEGIRSLTLRWENMLAVLD